jgi:hypothetical protein
VKDEAAQTKPVGSRLRARFVGIGLEDDLPEWRGDAARPATFEERSSRLQRFGNGVNPNDVNA